MSTELENNEVNEQVQTPEVNPVEQKAREMGWRPQEEWEGEPGEWIDAKEFVGRKPLYDEQQRIKRELRDTQKALNALKSHHERVRDVEYKRAIEALKQEKARALEDGDTKKLVDIDEQIIDLKAEEKASKQAPVSNQPHPNFIRWVEKNSWYAQDAELRAEADEIGIGHAMAHPEKTPDEVLEYVENKIKARIKNQNKARPSSVDTSDNSSKPVKRSDNFQLTEEEESVMKTFIKKGVMTKDEYIKEVKAMRGAS